MPKTLQNNLDYTKFARYARISSNESQIFFQSLYKNDFVKLKVIMLCPNCKFECTIDDDMSNKEFHCPNCDSCFEWTSEISKANFNYKVNTNKFCNPVKPRTSSPLEIFSSKSFSGEGKVIELSDVLKDKNNTGISVFLSYSHKDDIFKQELDTHLVMLKRNKIISTWNDSKIIPGQDIDEEVKKYLLSADIVILLISADFLSSDYCYEKEMLNALERHALGQTKVIPVIVRDCDWQETPFKNLKALPHDGKSISRWDDKDEAYLEVVKGIKTVINNIQQKTI